MDHPPGGEGLPGKNLPRRHPAALPAGQLKAMLATASQPSWRRCIRPSDSHSRWRQIDGKPAEAWPTPPWSELVDGGSCPS